MMLGPLVKPVQASEGLNLVSILAEEGQHEAVRPPTRLCK